MARVTVDDVKIWFNDTTYKLQLDDFLRERDLVEEEIIGKLTTRFDTSNWTTPQTTPQVVKTIIAMGIAAWRYRVLYTETTDQAMFARVLDSRVKKLLEGMLDGSIAIDETVKAQIKYFFPDNSTKPLFSLDMDF